jgi:glycosyltransferase involved in cell wall biosynthesis
MKLSFVNRFDAMGNSTGYATHQKNIEEALKKYVNITDSAEIALHICPVPHYKPAAGKLNFLYTMYEYEDLPLPWRMGLKNIDMIIVPCEHNKRLFERYTDIPVEVCLEGIDPEYYRFVPRSVGEYPFTFLWLGANNMRKGYLGVLRAWDKFYRLHQDCQLIIKTLKNTRKQDTGVRVHDTNVIIDDRMLPLHGATPTVLSVYAYAHAFLMPSMGEGFCLPLCEAVATGLPAIYTDHSGMRDYMSEQIGFPVGYQLVDIGTVEEYNRQQVNFITRAAWADTDQVVDRMEWIYAHYDQALEKARLGSEYMRKFLTWDKSAERLIDIISRYTEKEVSNA